MALVAVVDDHQLSRLFASRAIARIGLELKVVDPSSVASALGELRASKPDLILLDLLMHGCPGHSLLGAIRGSEELKEIPVIIVTASRDEELLSSVRMLGIHGCIFKPVDVFKLSQMVQEVLEPSTG